MPTGEKLKLLKNIKSLIYPGVIRALLYPYAFGPGRPRWLRSNPAGVTRCAKVHRSKGFWQLVYSGQRRKEEPGGKMSPSAGGGIDQEDYCCIRCADGEFFGPRVIDGVGVRISGFKGDQPPDHIILCSI